MDDLLEQGVDAGSGLGRKRQDLVGLASEDFDQFAQ